MKARLATILAALMAVPAMAAVDSNVQAVIDNANDTFEYVLPIAIVIIGIFIGISIAMKAWKKITSKG